MENIITIILTTILVFFVQQACLWVKDKLFKKNKKERLHNGKKKETK